MRTKAPTCDEFAHHVASGYSHLVTGDFRMNPAAPPLPRLLSAIPLYFIGAKAPLDHESWKQGNSPAFAQQFFYQANHTQDELIFWARIPLLILSVLFAYFVFRWARELFGLAGGIGALMLYVFCPDFLAHSGLATSDVSVAFFFYLTLWRFWKYLRKPSLKNMVITGVIAGCAMISKFSAILIFPSLFFIVALTGSWNKILFKRCVYFLVICLVTIWSGYFFEVKPFLKNTPDPQKKIAFLEKVGGAPLVRFASEVPVPLATFVSAFSCMMITRARGTNAFFMGEWSEGLKSWWYYYFAAFGIKNTIPFLLFVILSFLWIRKIPTDRMTKVFLLLPAALFFLVTLHDKAQAGIRYFLPIYPLFFIFCGGWISWVWEEKKAFRFVIIALLSWHALEALKSYPDYFSYFNELIGGSDRGYLYLRDSNIDWGQDLKGAAEWAKKENYGEVVVYSISTVDLEKAYGVRWRQFTTKDLRNPAHSVYVLGIHGIDKVPWYQKYKPVKIIGHSIWIYDLRNQELV